MRPLVISGLAFGLLLLVSAGPAMAKGGLYFGLDLGGAVVSGEENIPMKSSFSYPTAAACKSADPLFYCNDLHRTSGTGGVGVGLRFGYNFFGYGAVELTMLGHGNMDSGGGTTEGSVHAGALARIHPFQFFKQFKQRWWDPNIFFGGGYSFMGYHLKTYEQNGFVWVIGNKPNEGRGWTGMDLQFGVGSDFYLTDTVSVGLDLRFVKPMYKTYYYNWDENITFQPESTPSTLVFAPMAKLTFHFLAPNSDGGSLSDGSSGMEE